MGLRKLRNYTESKRKIFGNFIIKHQDAFALIINSSNVIGDDIKNQKIVKMFLYPMGVENCKYLLLCGLLKKDSYDVTLGWRHLRALL